MRGDHVGDDKSDHRLDQVLVIGETREERARGLFTSLFVAVGVDNAVLVDGRGRSFAEVVRESRQPDDQVFPVVSGKGVSMGVKTVTRMFKHVTLWVVGGALSNPDDSQNFWREIPI